METVIDYCLTHPYLLESILADIDYPTLCDRVYEFTNGEGLDAWLEEISIEYTPNEWLKIESLVRAIERVMAQKQRSRNNVINFPYDRLAA